MAVCFETVGRPPQHFGWMGSKNQGSFLDLTADGLKKRADETRRDEMGRSNLKPKR